jgi:hypothetical protein
MLQPAAEAVLDERDKTDMTWIGSEIKTTHNQHISIQKGNYGLHVFQRQQVQLGSPHFCPSWQIRGDGRFTVDWSRQHLTKCLSTKIWQHVRFMHKVWYCCCQSYLARKQLDACPADPTTTATPIIQAWLKADAEEFREHLIRLKHLMRMGLWFEQHTSSLSWPSLCVLQKQQLPAPRCRLRVCMLTTSQLIFFRG